MMLKLTIALVLTNLLLANPWGRFDTENNEFQDSEWRTYLETVESLEDDPIVFEKLMNATFGFFEGLNVHNYKADEIKECPIFNKDLFIKAENLATVFNNAKESFFSLATNAMDMGKSLFDLIHQDFVNHDCITKLNGPLKEELRSKLKKVKEAGITKIGRFILNNFSGIKSRASSAISAVREHDTYMFGKLAGEFVTYVFQLEN